MEKYRIVITNRLNGTTLAKMIVSEETKEVIEYMLWRDCFDDNTNIQIMPDDDDWKEFC